MESDGARGQGSWAQASEMKEKHRGPGGREASAMGCVIPQDGMGAWGSCM